MQKKILSLWNNNFWIILVTTTVLSYFQTLRMYVWKDDNAIFFKFNHLSEPAGYLGRGLLGEGVYKFSVTPYYLIYKLVGYEHIWVYYLLNLLFLVFAVLSVYLVFRSLLSEQGGRVAGFLYACGYIAAEGNYWLAASMIIHVSVILTSISLYFYVKYKHDRKLGYFIIAFLYYYLAVYLTPVRVHYFAFVLLLYDLFTITEKKKFISWVGWGVRSVPIVGVFYYTYLLHGDSRTSGVIDTARSIVHGEIQLLHSFFGTVGAMIVPDYFSDLYSNTVFQIVVMGLIVGIYYIISRNIKLSLFFMGSVTIWYFVSELIIDSLSGNIVSGTKFISFVGGVLVLFFVGLVASFKNHNRTILLFLLIWFIGSLYAYTSYLPQSTYPSTSRYLSHSFVALTGMMGLLFSDAKLQGKKLVMFVVIAWGLLNLFYNIRLQNTIVQERSIPAVSFYSQLRSFVPALSEGDIVYIDIADQARSSYAHAFSVSQMPEETALAWRYGLDRYDIRLVNDYDELTELLDEGSFENKEHEELSIRSVHSFFYDGTNLIETNLDAKPDTPTITYEVFDTDNELEVVLVDPYPSYSPLEVTISLQSRAFDPEKLIFPILSKTNGTRAVPDIYMNQDTQDLAYEYYLYKQQYRANTVVSSPNYWNDNISENIVDGNIDTYWRAHRVEWNEEGAFIDLDLGLPVEFDKFVWINKHPNSSPTKYELYTSQDNQNWDKVTMVESDNQLLANTYQIVTFDTQKAQYVRFNIVDTLNHDSAAIAEVWVVPTKFSSLDINETEEYLTKPFAYIGDSNQYTQTLQRFNNSGVVQIYWKLNKTNSYVTSGDSYLTVTYDGDLRQYSFPLPAGGTNLEKIKLVPVQIPGEINIRHIEIENSGTISL